MVSLVLYLGYILVILLMSAFIDDEMTMLRGEDRKYGTLYWVSKLRVF